MYQDPNLKLPHSNDRPGVGGWLRGLFGRGEEAAPPPASRVDQDSVPAPVVDALAEALSQLVSAAREQLDGASAIVDQSADEARDYGCVLAAGAKTLDDAALPEELASAVIKATQAMLVRTQRAEERLRGMGAELAKMRQDLEEAQSLAERDPLTGLPNRRALEKALHAAVGGAVAAHQALSLAYCDIDNFKDLNDRHGHALGDRVLRLVADCLADGAGPGSTVGRHGGEEFVMLFEGLGAEQAAVRVDTIRAQLATRALRSKTDDSPIGSITFSAGVAMLREDEPGEHLLHRADRALYRAKHKGRNRVEIDREG